MVKSNATLASEEWERVVMMAAAIMASGVLSTFPANQVDVQRAAELDACYNNIVDKLITENSSAIK